MSAAGFGIGLRAELPRGRYAGLARLAESLGFDAVSVFADLGFDAPLGPLLEIAAATRRVRVGAACLNPYTLHPVEIAAQVAALDVASGGRAFLGLSRGAWLTSLGIVQSRPLRTLREAAGVARLLLAGDAGGYRGEIFNVEPGFRLRHPAVQAQVPLLVGAWGPRTLRLAGEIADEVKVGGSANPDLVPWTASRLAEGARRAGRTSPPPAVVLGAITVVDEDGAAARGLARSAVAMYFDVVASLDPTIELPAGLLQDVRLRLKAGDDRAAGALIPDSLLDRFAFCGAPDRVAAHLRDVFDAGAVRVELGWPFGLDPERGLRLLGERVLPGLR